MKLKYPYYKENSNLPLVVITTVDGLSEYRINCKKINGVYYVKNLHLKYIDEKWIPKQAIIFDHELKKEVILTNQIRGIVSFTDGDTPVFGHFTHNPYTNCNIRSTRLGAVVCIDYKLLDPKYFKERYSRGYYVHTVNMSATEIKNLSAKTLGENNNNHGYNIEDNYDTFATQVELFKHSNFPIDFDVRLGSRYLRDITFGVELETINGTLPQHLLNTYGVIICKDGSIKSPEGIYPPEYVTVPYSGAKGVQALRNVSKEISLRSDIDIKCSYHLHIGNLKIDRLFIVSVFKLCSKIQDDVFKMFPYYKTDPRGIKEKNYCKKLPKDLLNTYKRGDFNTYVNDTYTDIFSFLSGGIRCDDEFNRENRRNPWPEGKWNIKTRYYWVNFVNLLFSKRDTIEFRLHSPTLNPDKIINWLFMCNAICRFAEKYPKQCITNKPISFVDVLNYYSSTSSTLYACNLSNNLINYYNQRCKMFQDDFNNNDAISNHELKNDNKFEHNALLLK